MLVEVRHIAARGSKSTLNCYILVFCASCVLLSGISSTFVIKYSLLMHRINPVTLFSIRRRFLQDTTLSEMLTIF